MTALDDGTLTARALTTQEIFRFGRRSGTSITLEADGAVCTIDSVAPLSDSIGDTLLGYDRRCRTSKDPDAGRLTVDERRALLDARQFYAANQIDRQTMSVRAPGRDPRLSRFKTLDCFGATAPRNDQMFNLHSAPNRSHPDCAPRDAHCE
ncbi:hypothetical protein [Bradyrhizobium sp. SZCCHNR1051]|uniref:hypothetical protein n=1 Tax=Bradyrhizobium sp. SZCCHNR1051 TaxID=3057355 RepID=UPI0029167D8F|nr:hypothetical protein [Bradyrhizobium sp. SZCCHNR1051]